MIIIGNKLKNLIKQHKISNDIQSYDKTCLSLRLDKIYLKIKIKRNTILNYGEQIPKKYILKKTILKDGLVIKPKQCILACSKEIISIPNGYFGLIQTKGTLARFFITVHCCDGQIDPGYNGKITFEICNFANFSVRLLEGQKVSNLYLIKASNKVKEGYIGKYQNADKPTIAIPEKN